MAEHLKFDSFTVILMVFAIVPNKVLNTGISVGSSNFDDTQTKLLAEEKSLEKEHSEYAVKMGRIVKLCKDASEKKDPKLMPPNDEVKKVLAEDAALKHKTALFRQRFDRWLQQDVSRWNSSVSEGLSADTYKQLLLKEQILNAERAEWRKKWDVLSQRQKNAQLKNDTSLGPTYFEVDIAVTREKAIQNKTTILHQLYNHWKEEDIKRCSAKARKLSNFVVDGLKQPVRIHVDCSYVLRSPIEGPSLIGGSVWDPAKDMAFYLGGSCKKDNWIRGKKVLDLSAGTGYLGVVAACLGGNVTLTDLPQMLPLMQQNIDENAAQIKDAGGKIRAQALKWGDEEAVTLLPKQDVILLSELVYYNESMQPLMSTVLSLSKKNTELIVSQTKFGFKEFGPIWDSFCKHINEYFKLSPVPPNESFHFHRNESYFLRGTYFR